MKWKKKLKKIGKLYNLIRFIQASYQQKQLFLDLVKAIPISQDKLKEKTKRFYITDINKTE